jgi:hypothetical protein
MAARVALELVAHQVPVLRRGDDQRLREVRGALVDVDQAAQMRRVFGVHGKTGVGIVEDRKRLVAHMHDARGLLPARLSLRLSKLFLDVFRQEARHVQDLPTVTRRCSGEGLWRPRSRKSDV